MLFTHLVETGLPFLLRQPLLVLAKSCEQGREVSGWMATLGGGVSWQRFIARLVAYGPVNTLVPGTILQTVPTRYTLLGGVADNCEISIK